MGSSQLRTVVECYWCPTGNSASDITRTKSPIEAENHGSTNQVLVNLSGRFYRDNHLILFPPGAAPAGPEFGANVNAAHQFLLTAQINARLIALSKPGDGLT